MTKTNSKPVTKRDMTTSRESAPTVVDLFSGAGGLSEGFRQVGYRVVGAVENWKPAVESFKANEPDAFVYPGDITTYNPADFAREIKTDVDLVLGGPSCQGFSTSSGLSRNGRKVHDPRNSLFRDFIRFVDYLQPSWVIMENVPGLLLYDKGSVAKVIIQEFRRIGYAVIPMILLAADFGVPQLRRRVIFIGNRTGQPISFPEPEHGDPKLWKDFALPFAHLSRLGNKNTSAGVLPHVSIEDACSDLPELHEGSSFPDGKYPNPAKTRFQKMMRKSSRTLTLHRSANLSELDRECIAHIPAGGNWRDLPIPLRDSRFGRIRPYDATTMMRRNLWSRPSHTITTKSGDPTAGAFIHPLHNRTFSIREAARIQSFPDAFQFIGSDSQIRELIGNAVPPFLAKKIALAIAPEIAQTAQKNFCPTIIPRVSFDPADSLKELLGIGQVDDSKQLKLFEPVPA